MNIRKILKEDNILEFNSSFKKLLENKLDEKLGLTESFDADEFEKELEDYTRGQLDARFEDNNSKLYNMNKSKPEYKVIQAKDEVFHKFYAKHKDKFKFPYVENDRGDKVKLRESTLTEAFDPEDIAEFFANGEHKKEVQAFLVGRKNIQDVYDELVDRDFDKDIIDDFKAQYM